MYVDTSALVALYVPEAISGAVAGALRGRAPAISPLTEVEFSSAIARRLRERSLSAADGAAVLRLFDSHAGERRYRRLALTAEVFAQAAVLVRAGAHPLSTLDALHLAVAAGNREALLTADRQLARAAPASGVKAILVQARKA